jgi:hypothetical protein
VQEIHFVGNAYGPDGSVLRETRMRGDYGFWPVIVNADADPAAEVGWLGEYWSLWDDDGTLLHHVDWSGMAGGTEGHAHPGVPCVADFDRDGAPEVAWGFRDAFTVRELDGTVLWATPADDPSGLAGCSAWDVDADGGMEVLYADETAFMVLDGPTGRTLWDTTDHASPTIYEYPTVADVDHDGHGDILVATVGERGLPTLTAWTHDGPGWAPASTHWPIHDYAVTNATENGGVPATPEPWWLTHNVFRARLAVDDPGTADLLVTFTDVCVADCTYGPVSVALQVGNQGGADVPAGATLALYAADDASDRLLRTVTLPAVPAGTLLEGVQLDLAPGDVGTRGFRAVVNDPATRTRYVHDCDTGNDVATWSDGACP